jgi:DNA modification methylase
MDNALRKEVAQEKHLLQSFIEASSNIDNIKHHNANPIDEKLFFSTENIKIYNDDFLTTTFIEENSIDLIVTSPPYNVDIHYN